MHGIGSGDAAWSATRFPFNQTSALAIMPLIRSSVRVARRSFGQGELGAIPPGDHEHVAAGIGLLGRTQVVAVEHVLVRAILQQPRHHRRAAAHRVPVAVENPAEETSAPLCCALALD
jgi:hypothetical protein